MSAIVLAAAVAFMAAPGATNPDVTQDNVRTTICAPGWSQSVRPSKQYTNALKRSQLAGRADPRLYEEDHLIPLSLGGAPSDPRNLWPQLWEDAREKDRLEKRLHRLVCLRRHALPLSEAQRAIATDWQAAYRRYVSWNP
jgi:hypothetical protein